MPLCLLGAFMLWQICHAASYRFSFCVTHHNPCGIFYKKHDFERGCSSLSTGNAICATREQSEAWFLPASLKFRSLVCRTQQGESNKAAETFLKSVITCHHVHHTSLPSAIWNTPLCSVPLTPSIQTHWMHVAIKRQSVAVPGNIWKEGTTLTWSIRHFK